MIFPYVKDYNLYVCPDTAPADFYPYSSPINVSGSTTIIAPSYGYNATLDHGDQYAQAIDNWRPQTGVTSSAINQPANKIMVGELRRDDFPFLDYRGGYNAQPPLLDGNPGSPYSITDCWGYLTTTTCSIPGKNQHNSGANFLFADGHVKLLQALPGILYGDSPGGGYLPSDPNVRHYWDYTYDG